MLMSLLAVTPLIWVGAAVVLVIWFFSLYNGLVGLKNIGQEAWAQIDVQLKRRHDLIPNLVKTAKGYMAHEQETLEKVIQARNAAVAAAPKGAGAAGAAEGMLSGMLRQFFALVESYPDLKANENMLALQEELASTENRIAFSRQHYNDSVRRYNTKLGQVPTNMIKNFGDFPPLEFFEIEDEAEREAPKVSF
ncbi:MAG: LemA family protein [Planctomycetota bacterium]|nr:LemA family protein [Planctomycetota bacterium]